MREQARASAAGLALVEEDAARRAGDGAVEVGVGEHDRRRLAAKLERDLLEVARRGLHDQLAHLGRAGESYLVHEIMCSERSAGGLAVAGQDIDDTGRETGLQYQLGESECAKRRLFGRFQHDRAAHRQRGR